MASQTNQKNIFDMLPYLPSNRGIVVDGKKYFGALESDSAIIISVIEGRQIHSWLRRSYTLEEFNDSDTEWSALTENKRRRLVTSRKMLPCPEELKNSGVCNKRHDREHREFFYHFAKHRHGSPVSNGSRVKCLYQRSGSRPCWERYNADHCRVFYHSNDTRC